MRCWVIFQILCSLLCSILSTFSIAGESDSVQQDIEEIQKYRFQEQQNIQQINQLNPLSEGLTPHPIPSNGLPGDAQAFGTENIGKNPQLEGFLKVLNHPITQSFLRYFSDPSVRQTIQKITQSPQRQNLIYAEAVWFVLWIVIRVWMSFRMSTAGLLKRLVVRLALYLLFIGVGSYLIPIHFLGEPYQKLITGLYRQVIRPHLP